MMQKAAMQRIKTIETHSYEATEKQWKMVKNLAEAIHKIDYTKRFELRREAIVLNYSGKLERMLKPASELLEYDIPIFVLNLAIEWVDKLNSIHEDFTITQSPIITPYLVPDPHPCILYRRDTLKDFAERVKDLEEIPHYYAESVINVFAQVRAITEFKGITTALTPLSETTRIDIRNRLGISA